MLLPFFIYNIPWPLHYHPLLVPLALAFFSIFHIQDWCPFSLLLSSAKHASLLWNTHSLQFVHHFLTFSFSISLSSFGFLCWLSMFWSFAIISMSLCLCSINSSIFFCCTCTTTWRVLFCVLLVECVCFCHFSLAVLVHPVHPHIDATLSWWIHSYSPVSALCLIVSFSCGVHQFKDLLAPEPSFVHIVQCLPIDHCFPWETIWVTNLINHVYDNILLSYSDCPLC